jgi:glycosidase
MTDRFANGDTTNDQGGLTDGSDVTGFDPTNPGYYHGGDLKGLTSKLNYIHSLGFTSIWITPPVSGQTVNQGSADYHGYWGKDFTTIDPHLGTEADFKNLVDTAHNLGMKVILDIVINHTGDYNYYPGGTTAYLDLNKYPYKDCNGKPFDITKVADTSAFPKLCLNKSFPYIPQIAPGDAQIRKPAFLNDLTNYHNRGNTNFDGISDLYGDFDGLDDLFTEKPEVLNGEISLWDSWITRFKIDGFRIDTARYVNPEFWNKFIPSVLSTAKANGIPGFAIFGEITETDPSLTSDFVINQSFPSVLDFPFQSVAQRYVTVSNTANQLAQFYNTDDYYTSATSSAYNLVTFLGNHDMGRIGNFIATADPNGSNEELTAIDEFAQGFLLLMRGAPTVYYGDEIGMTGTGGDQAARQDMFPTQVTSWQNELRIGSTPIGNGDGFAVKDPLQNTISTFNQLLANYPDLKTGTAQVKYGTGSVFAVARFSGTNEYLEVFNDSSDIQSASIPVTVGGKWDSIYGGSNTYDESNGSLKLNIPPYGITVLKSENNYQAPSNEKIILQPQSEDGNVPNWIQLTASVPGNSYNQITFDASSDGKNWQSLGTTDRRSFVGDYLAGGIYRGFLRPNIFPKAKNLKVVAVLAEPNGKIIYSNLINVAR